ncbi:MAG: CNNM domain-containing protein [Pirellulales bacterium]
MIFLYLLLACLLVALNGFFVLAEFAVVKMRPSRVKELIDDGVSRARSVQQIQDHLDEYLSVCQVGITFTSIGLGFIAEPAVVRLIEPLLTWSGLFADTSHMKWLTAHGVAFTISYLLVSFVHILVGELLPKSMAIRMTEWASLTTARPLQLFRLMFYVPLAVLNGCARIMLKLLGLGEPVGHEIHSEDELRIILEQSQSQGLMSFRRLLFLENVFDLGELGVRDAMRPRSQVRCMSTSMSWEENLSIARKYRFSRYPLIDGQSDDPIGLIHLKDMLLAGAHQPDLHDLVRPIITVQDATLLESLLAEMQRKRIHAALVKDSHGAWVGYLTLEDAIEEIIGTIRDEFEDEEHVQLADALREDRVALDVVADNTIQAVSEALDRADFSQLPVTKEQVLKAVEERERLVETYLGRGVGMPHARLPRLQKPIVFFVRSRQGITYRGTHERAHFLFVLLTPAGQPRVHQRLQAVIATLLDESEFIPERLGTATSPAEVLDILRTGEQAALD